MWGWMGLWMLIVWAGVVVLAISVASWLFPPTAPHASSARDTLDLRCARGDLTQEQYRPRIAPTPLISSGAGARRRYHAGGVRAAPPPGGEGSPRVGPITNTGPCAQYGLDLIVLTVLTR